MRQQRNHSHPSGFLPTLRYILVFLPLQYLCYSKQNETQKVYIFYFFRVKYVNYYIVPKLGVPSPPRTL